MKWPHNSFLSLIAKRNAPLRCYHPLATAATSLVLSAPPNVRQGRNGTTAGHGQGHHSKALAPILLPWRSTLPRHHSTTIPPPPPPDSNSIPSQTIGGFPIVHFCQLIKNSIPFGRIHFDLEIEHIDIGHIIVLLPYQQKYAGLSPSSMHTGPVSAMVDQIAGFCVWSMLDNTELFVNTVDFNIVFNGSVPCSDIWIEAKCVQIGKKYAIVETKCYAPVPAPANTDHSGSGGEGSAGSGGSSAGDRDAERYEVSAVHAAALRRLHGQPLATTAGTAVTACRHDRSSSSSTTQAAAGPGPALRLVATSSATFNIYRLKEKSTKHFTSDSKPLRE